MPDVSDVHREDERPERMFRKGRFADKEFEPGEPLYFRVIPEHIVDENTVDLSGIRFPDFSTNRGKYSEPEDVLFGHPDLNIALFLVGNIPPRHITEGETLYEFGVEHVPEDSRGVENFSHSEVRTYKNQHERVIKCFDVKAKTPVTVRARFRCMLALKAKPYTESEGATTSPSLPDKSNASPSHFA